MSKENNNSVKEAIKAYLDDRAKNDELFAKSYAKANKNIDECFRVCHRRSKKERKCRLHVRC